MMVNPDHARGGFNAVSAVLAATAVAHLLIGYFASEQLAELFGFPGGAGAANAVARTCAAYAAVYALGAILLLFIGASPRTRAIMVAFISFAVFASCLFGIAIFASSTTLAYGWWLLGGMLGSVAACALAARRADSLSRDPKTFANPTSR